MMTIGLEVGSAEPLQNYLGMILYIERLFYIAVIFSLQFVGS